MYVVPHNKLFGQRNAPSTIQQGKIMAKIKTKRERVKFASDNVAGACPEVLDAIIKANDEPFKLSPPKVKTETTTYKVVKEVIKVLLSVSFKDKLTISFNSMFEYSIIFSLIRSKTTIVSFREYPIIIRKAATIYVSNSYEKNIKNVVTIKTS